MPKFQLCFKAQMEGIEKLTLPSDYRFNIDCQHPSSGEPHNNLWVSIEEELEIPGSRGTCNVLVKVGDKRHGTIKMDFNGFTYTSEMSGKFAPVATFECRDLEPTKWIIQADDWVAYGQDEKAKFDDIQIEENAWFDYDDEVGQEVSMQEFAFEFKRVH
eukprot:TRINITY_DN37773_c0_g1_i1.p1 TRINITY_DN37773_c0_g1~~TRINITY_DN37773_c0_g1_i1.p1  ORF type:complete len:173 (+),score=32.39 TRINITY_DN37773_c0_g1_i1:45-521(+)